MLNPLFECEESDLNSTNRLLVKDGILLGGGRFPQNFPISGDVAKGPFLMRSTNNIQYDSLLIRLKITTKLLVNLISK